jgi:hypothetical protein
VVGDCGRSAINFKDGAGQRRAVTISANLTPGYGMRDALSFFELPGVFCRRARRSTMRVSREFTLSSSLALRLIGFLS